MAMCGGIINALTLSLSAEIRNQSLRFFSLICAYNLGRISSYTLMGALVGYLSYLSPLSSVNSLPYVFMQYLASIFLIGLGLHVAGWFPQMKKIESVGMYIWKYLRVFAGNFVPANTISRSIMAGLIWGWLPCGMVYAVLLWTLSSVSPANGAIYMLMFGLGTLPSMIFMGLASNAITTILSLKRLRVTTGLIIILLGLASPVLKLGLVDNSGSATNNDQHSYH